MYKRQDKGLAVYAVVRDKKIADVSMTGGWELALSKIATGEITRIENKPGQVLPLSLIHISTGKPDKDGMATLVAELHEVIRANTPDLSLIHI